jgi:hypothetical protein
MHMKKENISSALAATIFDKNIESLSCCAS